jgi:hypothetical protein
MLTGKTIGDLPLLPYDVLNDNVLVPVEASGSTYHVPFSDILHRPFASYIDTTTQSLSGSNTPTVISYNTVVIESGITLSDSTKITVVKPGVYSVGISMQFDKSSGLSLEPIYIWTRVNGEDVPDSAGEIRLLNNNSEALPFIPYTYELNANDYIEFVFASSDSGVFLSYIPSSDAPYLRPGSPSITLDIKQIS